jgi:putative hydrolase of the HAD superfamily
MVRAILFDLDRTLVDRDTSIRLFFEAQWHNCRVTHEGLRSCQAWVERLLELDRQGFSNKNENYLILAREFALPEETARNLAANFRERFGRAVLLFPGVAELLTDLRRQGYRLGIITNGSTQVQRAKIETTRLKPLVDVVVISEQEGIKKPAPEIFARALSRLGVTADEALFVGDNLELDIRGGRSAGLRTIWLCPSTAPFAAEADARVESVAELGSAILRLASTTHPVSP